MVLNKILIKNYKKGFNWVIIHFSVIVLYLDAKCVIAGKLSKSRKLLNQNVILSSLSLEPSAFASLRNYVTQCDVSLIYGYLIIRGSWKLSIYIL